jgi:hypothetical protein
MNTLWHFPFLSPPFHPTRHEQYCGHVVVAARTTLVWRNGSESIHIYQWAILVLLLTLQSVAVTVADAVTCEGCGWAYFVSTKSHFGSHRGVPFVALLDGVLHLACVSIICIPRRKRAVSTPIIQRIFHYWWWPFDFMIRKVAVVVIRLSMEQFHRSKSCRCHCCCQRTCASFASARTETTCVQDGRAVWSASASCFASRYSAPSMHFRNGP